MIRNLHVRWCVGILLGSPALFGAAIGVTELAGLLMHTHEILSCVLIGIGVPLQWAWILLSFWSLSKSIPALNYFRDRTWSLRLMACLAIVMGLMPAILAYGCVRIYGVP